LKNDKLSLSDHYEKKSKTNDLFQYVFSSVAGKKGTYMYIYVYVCIYILRSIYTYKYMYIDIHKY
jgi:hypothetical protein